MSPAVGRGRSAHHRRRARTRCAPTGRRAYRPATPSAASSTVWTRSRAPASCSRSGGPAPRRAPTAPPSRPGRGRRPPAPARPRRARRAPARSPARPPGLRGADGSLASVAHGSTGSRPTTPVGDADAQPVARAHLGRRAQHRQHRVVGDALDDRVAAGQRRGGAERGEAGAGVLAGRPRAGRARAARAPRRSARAAGATARSRASIARRGSAEDRARAARRAPCCSRSTQPCRARRARSRRPRDARGLLGEVGHHPLAGVGRGGAADVGDVVDQRGVRLVPDRRDHRRAARRDRPAQRLVGERQQVLDAAAAAGEHDHVDVRVAVERAQRVDDLRHGQRALHGGVLDPEPHGGPAGLRVR